MPENLFLAYQRSGKPFYRELAKRFLEDDTYFGPLSEGNNALPGEHAYSHVNAFSSAMQAYLSLGSETHLRAAKNGFAMLVTAQSYATGGWGPNETLVEPNCGQLGDALTKTHNSFETPCGAYAHFKLCRYLLRVTQDSQYGDSMERILYNTILGAKPIQPDGRSFYYSDYALPAGKKGFHHDKWPCCSGTLPQLAADYHIGIYFRSDHGICVNLYTPSALRWESDGATLGVKQRTKYPFENTVQIQVSASRPAEQTIHLRIPSWVGSGAVVSVNGKRVSEPVQPGTFAAIRRTWNDRDLIEMELPMPLRLEPVDAQHSNLVALMRGPLVLFALGESQPSFERPKLLRARIVNNSQGDSVAVSAEERNIVMRPFMSIVDESYCTYCSLKA